MAFTSTMSSWDAHLALDTHRDYTHNVILIVLGEFEYLMLSAAAKLGEDAYGAAIRQEIEAATGQPCSLGALYTTLDRLEHKGLVRTWMGDPTPERGGRPKRRVRLTAKGVRSAREFYAAVTQVSRGVSWESHCEMLIL
jgi:DNA-binding PadR family transcriptional regulator